MFFSTQIFTFLYIYPDMYFFHKIDFKLNKTIWWFDSRFNCRVTDPWKDVDMNFSRAKSGRYTSASESLDLYTHVTKIIDKISRVKLIITRGYNLSVPTRPIMILVLCWSILLNSVIGQQILTPDDMRIVRDNDKFLYKYLPQVVKKIV